MVNYPTLAYTSGSLTSKNNLINFKERYFKQLT